MTDFSVVIKNKDGVQETTPDVLIPVWVISCSSVSVYTSSLVVIIMWKISLAFVLFCVKSVWLHGECVIELECEECIPDNMPIVTSHTAANGSIVVQDGERVALSCHTARFTQYPARAALAATCVSGRFRVQHDRLLRHLLDLGCQENIYEDVLHHVDDCGAPYEGRAYQLAELQAMRHYVTLCFDSDRAITLRAHMTTIKHNYLQMGPHDDARSPLSLLGNFNQMFDSKTRSDAEKLFSDDHKMNKRLHELLKHERHCFAGQMLSSAKLLSSHYFEDQTMRVTNFISNRVPVWMSVAKGNLQNLHNDVSKFIKKVRSNAKLDIYAGTHGVATLREDSERIELYLKAEKRFPVPKFIWTVIHDTTNEKAVALVTLNDPFVAVSEIRDSVFCESGCSKIPWLKELRRNHNYETPVYGLIFCCTVHNFTTVVNEMPMKVFNRVPLGEDGLLINV